MNQLDRYIEREDITEQYELGEVWDRLDTPILLVLDEQGRNIGGAQVRGLLQPEGYFDLWLYVDEVDGFKVIDDLDWITDIGGSTQRVQP